MKNLTTILSALILLGSLTLGLQGQEAKTQSEVKKKEQAEKQDPFESVHSTPRVQFSVSLSPKDAYPGETVTLTISAKVHSGWHIYGIADDDSVGGLPTKIRARSRSLQPVNDVFTPSTAPTEVDVDGEKQMHHSGEFAWTRNYKVKTGVENYFASGSIAFQVCDKSTCLPPKRITFRVGLKPGEEPAGPPKTVTQKPKGKTIGDPIVVDLEACEATRRKVKFEMSDVFSAGTGKDKLALRGSIEVDGKKTEIYLPKSNRYKLTNSGSEETLFGNDSTYISLDYDRDGSLGKCEYSACNRPIRIDDSMFQVTGINPTKLTITFQQVDVPLSGAILNRRCPEFEFKTVDGKTINNKSILGKVTILDIWAVT